jgi:hypothetical protein
LRRGIRSLGLLAATLLGRSLARARRLEIGLAARGFEGELKVLTPPRALSTTRLAQDVFFGPLNQRLSEFRAHVRVTEALSAMDISHLAERLTHLLSFGQSHPISAGRTGTADGGGVDHPPERPGRGRPASRLMDRAGP